MATPKWEPGKLYPPGSLVVPRTAPLVGATALTNPSFEDGSTGWEEFDGSAPHSSWSFESTAGQAYQGTGYVRWVGAPHAGRYLYNEAILSVGPGTTVSTSAYFVSEGAKDEVGGHVVIVWQDVNDNVLRFDIGNQAGIGGWKVSTATKTAPAGAVKARVGFGCYNLQGGTVRVDLMSLNYVPYVSAALQYKAVQPEAGYSDNAEPVWPNTLGVQVNDNEVIWEAVNISRVVWEARPILRSGLVEPDWPTSPGAFVADNTISWKAVSRRVEDAKCPQSKHVVIAASKVFAGDDDIIAYSATVNPLDWSSANDAGYLPFGLQLYGANPVSAMGLYRGNVVAFNAQGGQVWQVDEDPQLMQLLDAFPIGTQYHHTLAPVTNDLFMLTQLGVRTLGIAAGSTNLQAGDVGLPIDPLVQEALEVANANGIEPMSLYNPNAGQYWLMFPEYPPSEVVIHGDLEYAAINVPLPPFSYWGTGGVKPYTFRLHGDTQMPPGLTLHSDGSVTGTPTQSGEFTWEVEIEDAHGGTDWLTDTAEVVVGPEMSGEAPDGTEGSAYTFTYTVTPGDAPIDRTEIIGGYLLSGLAWDEETATISGTPTQPGTMALTFRVYDEYGLTATHSDTILIAAQYGWLLSGNFTDNKGLKPSPDGVQWTSGGYAATGFSQTEQTRAYRVGGEVLFTGAGGCVLSVDAGAETPWTSLAVTMDFGGGEAAYVEGKWYISAGNTYATYVYDGTLTQVDWNARHLTSARRGGEDRLFTVGSNTSHLIYCRDEDGVALWSAQFRSSGSGNGVELGSDGETVVIMHLNWAGDVFLSKITPLADECVSIASPFSQSNSGYIRRIKYSRGLGLWMLISNQEIAYGTSIDSLTLSSYTLPEEPRGIDEDGTKFVIVGANRMALATSDGETFVPLTVSDTITSTVFRAVVALENSEDA